MNQEFESRLVDLMNEAKQKGMPAAHVVLHMLLGAHTTGTQGEFAKWCCKFSPVQIEFKADDPEIMDDFPTDLDEA
ncbi:MAG: hypothetical protein AB7O81_00450 [Blastocatellales bacterium]